MESHEHDTRVGISDYKIAQGPGRLITVGLGSCIGTIIYDEQTHIAGLSHIMLPDSHPFEGKSNNIKLEKFANLALPKMVEDLRHQTGSHMLRAKVVGGANMFNFSTSSQTGNIGQRNIEAVEQMLTELHIPIVAKHVGGHSGRTMIVDLVTFDTCVKIVNHDSVYL